jgi:hypothetical protein
MALFVRVEELSDMSPLVQFLQDFHPAAHTNTVSKRNHHSLLEVGHRQL